MAKCKKCNRIELEWINDNGRWRLYEPQTGEFHNCKLTAEEYKKIQEQKMQSASCKHGVLKTRSCDLCSYENY